MRPMAELTVRKYIYNENITNLRFVYTHPSLEINAIVVFVFARKNVLLTAVILGVEEELKRMLLYPARDVQNRKW